MAREVDEKKTRKALRKLRRAAARVEEPGGPGLTDWEKQFVEGVSERLETYGSAFRDPGKGALDEALSARQSQVVRAIDEKGRKAKPPADAAGGNPPAPEPPRLGPRSTFRRKGAERVSRSRDIHEDVEPLTSQPAPAPTAPEPAVPPSAGKRRASLRVIPGGKGR